MRFFAIASLIFTAATSVYAGAVAKRDTPPGVATILTNLNSQVSSYTNTLKSLSADEATEANVQPPVDGINSALNNAIGQLQALKGQPSSVIMAAANGDGTASTDDIGDLLGDAIQDILGAVQEILEVVGDELLPDVESLLSEVGGIVNNLLGAVGELVTGVLDLVEGILQGLATAISDLGLTGQYDETLGYSISS